MTNFLEKIVGRLFEFESDSTRYIVGMSNHLSENCDEDFGKRLIFTLSPDRLAALTDKDYTDAKELRQIFPTLSIKDRENIARNSIIYDKDSLSFVGPYCQLDINGREYRLAILRLAGENSKEPIGGNTIIAVTKPDFQVYVFNGGYIAPNYLQEKMPRISDREVATAIADFITKNV